MSPTESLARRLEFFGLDGDDLERLERLRPEIEANADAFVEAFYRHLLRFPEVAHLLEDSAVRERLLGQQRDYLLSLAEPSLDEAYAERRRKIGFVHERVGLDVQWYLGAYALYLSLLMPLVARVHAGDPDVMAKTAVALERRLLLDATLAIETYVARRERDLARANAELAKSTERLEVLLEERRHQLRETTARAHAAEELADVATLVAGLAHEIGTPMGVIQGHAKMLEAEVESDDGRWRLQTIREQIGRISNIIQTLLNMARPGKGKRAPVALDALVERTLAFLAERLGRRRVEIDVDMRPLPSVPGDAERLQQVLLNLFLNAADAMPEGGTLRVELRPGPDGGAVVEVHDTGVGIEVELLDRVFEPFYTSKPAGKGSGLGLAVARGIVSDHGGQLSVRSVPGGGAIFRVELPGA